MNHEYKGNSDERENSIEKGMVKQMNILFINGSPNKEGNTVNLAGNLLEGKEYDTLHLVDYKIYSYGQEYADDQFMEV
ncbi:MAG: hypothetical protein Q4D32_11285, partial [Eubacteriales bacterium]|nr:hypothetical protein [Eubacteriales bacterium]